MKPILERPYCLLRRCMAVVSAVPPHKHTIPVPVVPNFTQGSDPDDPHRDNIESDCIY